LKRELPQLKTFCTLSPIPGFMAWLGKQNAASLPERAGRAHEVLMAACEGELNALSQATRLAGLSGNAHHALWRLAAHYLMQAPQPQGDPVARFHLDNGARLERLNAQANLASKGLKQSAGLMVNYLYDLGRIERHHDRFAHGEVVASRAISALL